jgi:HEAT repeat protein
VRSCQRLPNGNIFLAGPREIAEFTPTGQELSSYGVSGDIFLTDAWKQRSGRVLCRHHEGVSELNLSGRELRGGPVEAEKLESVAVLPDDRYVLSDETHNRLLEVNATGQTLHSWPVRSAKCVEALRNGNYLVSTGFLPRVMEMDAGGRTIWEVATAGGVNRVRVILDKIRIGFDKPLPADFDLDSVAHRVRDLKDADEKVRFWAAIYLCELRPTDEISLDALTAALDDDSLLVRRQASETMAKIGERAVPRLIQTLRKGTNRSRHPAVSALKELGPLSKDAVPDLVELVKNTKTDPDIRNDAIIAMARIGSQAKGAVPALLAIAHATEETAGLRKEAILALGDIGTEASAIVPLLIDILKDAKQPDSLRCAAAGVLGSFGPTSTPALHVFRDLVRDPQLSRGLARKSAAALSCMGKDGVPTLVMAIKEGNQLTRCYAMCQVVSLGEHAGPVRLAIEQAVNDPDPEVGNLASTLLQMINESKRNNPRRGW